MMDLYSLSEDQLEKLKGGEPVEVNSRYGDTDAKIHPPCGENNHDWGHYTLDTGGRTVVRRSCAKCGKVEEKEVDVEKIFEGSLGVV